MDSGQAAPTLYARGSAAGNRADRRHVSVVPQNPFTTGRMMALGLLAE
jgi:hypothetical protein